MNKRNTQRNMCDYMLEVELELHQSRKQYIQKTVNSEFRKKLTCLFNLNKIVRVITRLTF